MLLLLVRSDAKADDPIDSMAKTLFLFEQQPASDPNDPDLKKIKELLDAVQKDRALQHKLIGTVEVGFSGDEAGPQEVFRLKTAVKFSLGTYPREFRTEAEAQIRFGDDTLEEEVTRLLVNYDYYFTPWLEAYGFVERFSDSFMSIDQRYEVGVGAKFEWNPFDVSSSSSLRCGQGRQPRGYTKRGLRELCSFDNLSRLDKGALGSRLPDIKGAPSREDRVLQFSKYVSEVVFESMKKRYSKIQIGLATSIFSELEQSEIETEVTTAGVSEARTFTLPSEQRFRWVLRPTVLIRPNDAIEISAKYYYKLPLGSPVETFGRRDVRSDFFGDVRYKLGESETGMEKASVIFAYEQHHDSAAPRLEEATLAAIAAGGGTVSTSVAESDHHVYRMTLAINFN